MKLTWFAGTTMRIHIGGKILVADADAAPDFVDRRELLSGADQTFALARGDYRLPEVDPAVWRPRRGVSQLEAEADDQAPRLLRIGTDAVLIDAIGEPPLALLASGTPPRFGRWAEDSVVVLFGSGEDCVALGTVLLDVATPRLLALAADEGAVEHAVAELGEHLDGTALVSLEPGMALEV